jgi:hypothetical protein
VKFDNWLKQDQFACITSDAWSNIKNESVINYMMISGEVTLFLEATQSGEQSHTSEYLAADLARVISLTNGQISGVEMDNTAANKKTWKIFLPRLCCTWPSSARERCVRGNKSEVRETSG